MDTCTMCYELQSTESEVITSTCYADLFLRKITSRHLLSVFLRFMFVESDPNHHHLNNQQRTVIDSITLRLNSSSSSKLCQVTLSFFHTLISLNCEDVMFWLIFR